MRVIFGGGKRRPRGVLREIRRQAKTIEELVQAPLERLRAFICCIIGLLESLQRIINPLKSAGFAVFS